MLSVPAWLATAVGSLILLLLGVIGYLVRLVVSTSQERLDTQDTKISGLYGKLDDIKSSLLAIDRRFVEAELIATKQFVDKETYTRDYITMTGRVDAVHKRVDRIERGGVGD